jgi:hypothetical protein
MSRTHANTPGVREQRDLDPKWYTVSRPLVRPDGGSRGSELGRSAARPTASDQGRRWKHHPRNGSPPPVAETGRGSNVVGGQPDRVVAAGMGDRRAARPFGYAARWPRSRAGAGRLVSQTGRQGSSARTSGATRYRT